MVVCFFCFVFISLMFDVGSKREMIGLGFLVGDLKENSYWVFLVLNSKS
jgi:hypothetical protein